MVQNTVIQMETLKLEQIDQQKQALRFHQMIDALPQVRMKQSWIAGRRHDSDIPPVGAGDSLRSFISA